MNEGIQNKQFVLKQPLVLLIIMWSMLVCFYVESLQNGRALRQWDGVIYILQLTADICIGVFSYLSYRVKTEQESRTFFFLIFISIIPGLFTNEVYNFLSNVLNITHKTYASLYWSISYTMFLVCQVVAWSYLLLKKIKNKSDPGNRISIYPYLYSACIISLSLVFIILIKHADMGFVGYCKMANSFIEIITFILVSICLSRTKNKSLIYLEVGFLLLVGFNFAHRYSDILSSYFKVFNVVWMSCLIVIIYALYKIKSEKNNIIFFEENSMHVLFSGAFVLFVNVILTVFIFVAFGLFLLQIDKAPSMRVLAIDIPSALIFSYTLTVLLAKYLAWRLYVPLEQIVQKIHRIANNHIIDEGNIDSFKINEIQELECFITRTVSELHHANQVKAELMMNMSHDFRTPVSGIMNMSRLIYDRMSINDELKIFQKMVVESSEQLMTLLEDVLDYSRFNNGKPILHETQFNLLDLLNDVIAFVRVKLKEKGLSLTLDYSCKVIYYQGDKAVVQRILLNLLSNAIKFTHTGGVKVVVSIKPIDNVNKIIIKIIDTGVGIDKSNYQKIFEPFYRVTSADLSQYPGIGLGLSNVNLMLKQISGSIHLVSELGKGSEFCVLLPV